MKLGRYEIKPAMTKTKGPVLSTVDSDTDNNIFFGWQVTPMLTFCISITFQWRADSDVSKKTMPSLVSETS